MAELPVPKPRASSGLASEFYIAYQLYQRGYLGVVTYGNQKAVDLIAVRPRDGKTATLDVKSIKNRTNWPLTLRGAVPPGRHFYAFVSYMNQYEDPNTVPDVWIVPARDLKGLLKPWSRASKKQTCVPFRDLNTPANRKRYVNRWHRLFGR